MPRPAAAPKRGRLPLRKSSDKKGTKKKNTPRYVEREIDGKMQKVRLKKNGDIIPPAKYVEKTVDGKIKKIRVKNDGTLAKQRGRIDELPPDKWFLIPLQVRNLSKHLGITGTGAAAAARITESEVDYAYEFFKQMVLAALDDVSDKKRPFRSVAVTPDHFVQAADVMHPTPATPLIDALGPNLGVPEKTK